MDWRWWGWIHRRGHVKVGGILLVGGRQKLGHVIQTRWLNRAVANIGLIDGHW